MDALRGANVALGAALVAVALAGCSFVSAEPEPVAASPTPQPTASSDGGTNLSLTEGGALDPRTDPLGGDHQSVVDAACGGSPAGTDLGARYGANGPADASGADGLVATYAVVAGDSYKAIVERFCLNSRTFATINFIDDIGQVYAGDVYAFTEDAAVAARRAEGLDFATCRRDTWGLPQLASISWQPLSDTRIKATGIGVPVDTGAAGTAQGEARVDADGALVDYVVAAGDTWRGIEDRFCMNTYYVSSLVGEFGGYPMIHPGDVIPLQPQYVELPFG